MCRGWNLAGVGSASTGHGTNIASKFISANSAHFTIETTTCTLLFIVTNPLAISFYYATTTLINPAVGYPMFFANASCVPVAITATMMFADVFRCQVMQANMLNLFIVV